MTGSDSVALSALAATSTRVAAAICSRAPYRRALVVANPIAGRGCGEVVAKKLAAGLTRLGVANEVHLTRARGDGTARVRDRHPETDLVVSVGGDGTLREVLEALPDGDVPVAAVPLGTGNVIGRDLGLPRSVDGALAMIAGRRSTAIDVGTANGELTVLGTSVGFDALVVREVEAARRGPMTKWFYVAGARRALSTYEPPELAVEIDGERLDGSYGFVLIANVVHYGAFFRLAPTRRLDDGRFEVYLWRDARPKKLAAAAARALVGCAPGSACEIRLARRVRVTAPAPIPYQVDGEARGATPLEFAVASKGRRILVP
jgi:YegS/Rv2252/BmrU family lipid kinase